MNTFPQIIGMWPSVSALAKDLGEQDVTVRAWKGRGSIPASRWVDLIAAARRRGLQISFKNLAEAAKRKTKTEAETAQ